MKCRNSIAQVLTSGLLTDRTVRWRTVSTVAAVSNNAGTPEKQVKADNISSITHHYRGSFEAVERNWKLHTETGFYDLNERKHYFYVKDRLGSTVAVVDDAGRTRQLTAYYPSGVPYDLFGFQRKTDRLHIGNRWLEAAGLFSYDNTARFHYPLIPSFDTPDLLAEKYPQFSPYAHCAGNPLRYVDPTGMIITMPKESTHNEVITVLNNLQRLTNDHIVYKTQSDGSVRFKIASLGKGNLIAGTRLIRKINSSAKNMSINVVSFGDNRIKSSYPASSNGQGTDVKITFNPNFNPDINTQNPHTGFIQKEKRPSFVGLAHEMIHGIRNMQGKSFKYDLFGTHHFLTPDGCFTERVRINELITIGLGNYNSQGDITENAIRIEHQLNKRATYDGKIK